MSLLLLLTQLHLLLVVLCFVSASASAVSSLVSSIFQLCSAINCNYETAYVRRERAINCTFAMGNSKVRAKTVTCEVLRLLFCWPGHDCLLRALLLNASMQLPQIGRVSGLARELQNKHANTHTNTRAHAPHTPRCRQNCKATVHVWQHCQRC